jgi:hypothetical protein
VASRTTSASANPGAGSSRLPGFAQPRYQPLRLTIAGLPRRCIVRIDEHGSEDRAKDASPIRMRRCPVPASGAYAYECVSRRRSPPRQPTGHPLSPARSIPAEEPADTDHEPTKASIPTTHREACRLREDRDAFRRHDTRRNVSRRDESLRTSCRLSRSRRPHFFPQMGRVPLLGIASVTVRSPAIRDCSTRRWVESTDAFFTPRVTPGTDDPSVPSGSTDSAVDGS